MENPISMIEAHQRRVDEMNGTLEIGPNGTSLDLLRVIYRNAALALPVRMRAAIAALPFEAPKLAVTALVSEQDFASLLERRLKHQAAIEANGGNNQIPNRQVETKPPLPRIADRRFRRI